MHCVTFQDVNCHLKFRIFRSISSFPTVTHSDILLHILQLTEAVGKVKVQTTQFDYYNYQPKDPDLDGDGTSSNDCVNKCSKYDSMKWLAN